MIVRFQNKSFNLPKIIVHFMNNTPFSKKYRSIYLKWSSILLMTLISRREKSFFISKLFFVSCWFRSWVMSFRSCHDQFPTLTWFHQFFWNFQSGLQQNFVWWSYGDALAVGSPRGNSQKKILRCGWSFKPKYTVGQNANVARKIY